MATLLLPHLWSPSGWLAFDGFCAAAVALLSRALLPAGSPPLPLAAAPLLAGAGALLLLRALPRPSEAALEAAEAHVLSDVRAPI
jgi:hypothetical protein